MSGLSCHVLDTASGQPARCILVELYDFDTGSQIASDTTNEDGRIKFDNINLSVGNYTLHFLVKPYCEKHFNSAFFPRIDINFSVDGLRNYHIPLLLSPYSYSSYRGS